MRRRTICYEVICDIIEGDVMTTGALMNARRFLLPSLGVALAMSLSSLVLWEGGWTPSPFIGIESFHFLSLVVGTISGLGVMLWYCLSPRSLFVFLRTTFPLLFVLSYALMFPLEGSGISAVQVALLVIVIAGTNMLLFAWFCSFVNREIENVLLDLLLAWLISVPLRAAFGLVQDENTKMIASLVLACAAWALLLLGTRGRTSGFDAASPKENAISHIHAFRSIWKSVLYGGSFAFLSGVVRALSLQEGVASYINNASMLGGWIAAVAIIVIWRFKTIRFNVGSLFRMTFPVFILLFVAWSYFDIGSIIVVAAAVYVLYSFSSLLLQVFCIQVSYDFGVNPVFCFSFQIFVCVAMQGLGFGSWALVQSANPGVPPHVLVSLLSVSMLALVLYVTRGISVTKEGEGRKVEFISLSAARAAKTGALASGTSTSLSDGKAGSLEGDSDEQVEAVGASEPVLSKGEGQENSDFLDRVDLRCNLVAKKYFLSQRELEILNLFARGYTMAAIAKELYISDNTVKTHVRRLYSKLGIHKKSELIAIVNNYVE